MPFKKGERLPNQGGKRANAGRPSRADVFLLNQQTTAFLREFLRDVPTMAKHAREQFFVDNTVVNTTIREAMKASSGQEQAQNRPIAIQIILEGNSNGASAQGTGNGRSILIGGE